MTWPGRTTATGRRLIRAIDVHAEGELGRVLIADDVELEGVTVAEKLKSAEAELEDLRQLLLHEPRGYPATCAVLVLPPAQAGSDFSIIVMEQGGFRAMSGSNLICAVTGMVEAGRAGSGTLRIDTAAGLVEVEAEVVDGRARRVRFDNVPSFVIELDHPLRVPEYGTIPADIVFGGQFYAQVRAQDLGLELVPQAAAAIARAGAAVRAAAIASVPVQHPLEPTLDAFGLVMIHGPSDSGERLRGRNAVVMPSGVADLNDPATWTGVFDRSPCGTGTSGRMAAMHARGELSVGETFVHESMLGTEFIGRINGTTRLGAYEAILPSISGRGFVAGFHEFVLEPDDPFPRGYTVGDIWGSTS